MMDVPLDPRVDPRKWRAFRPRLVRVLWFMAYQTAPPAEGDDE